MKKWLHIAAVSIAAVNLIISVLSYLCFLYLSNNAMLAGSLGLEHKQYVIHALDLLCLAASLVFLVCIFKRLLPLTCVYWFSIAASAMLVFGVDPLTMFIAMCFALVGMIFLFTKLKQKVKYIVMLILSGVVLMIEALAIVGAGELTLLFAAVFPWYPAAPLLPALATMFMTAAQKAE